MDSKIEAVFDNIVEFIDLQRDFNLDIDKRVSRHDKVLLRHERSISKLQKDYKITSTAVKDMRKYFNKKYNG